MVHSNPIERRLLVTRMAAWASFGWLFILFIAPSWAQEGSSAEPFEDNASEGAANLAGIARLTSNFEFLLSIFVLIFATFVILLQYRLVTRKAADFKPDTILRMTLITPIIMGTVFFVTAGFDSQQIAPAMGLFGTIAGYILGKEAGRSEARPVAKKEGASDDSTKEDST